MTVYQSLVKQCVKTILWGVGVLLLSVVGIALAFRYFPNFWIVSGFALTIPLSLICALITIQRIRCPQCRKSVGSAAVYSAFFRVLAEPIQFCPHCVLNLRTSVADVPTIGLSRQNEPRPSPLELTLQQILYKKLRVGGIAGIGFIASFMIFGIY